MELSGDELAGVVDLFGALTREELRRACGELAFRHGEEAEPAAFTERIEAAVDSFALVRYGEDPDLLAPGPAALPALPDGAPDLPHILDIEPRTVDRAAVADHVEDRIEAAAADAVEAGDADRAAELRELTYDAEAWGPLDLAAVRERLDGVD